MILSKSNKKIEKEPHGLAVSETIRLKISDSIARNNELNLFWINDSFISATSYSF